MDDDDDSDADELVVVYPTSIHKATTVNDESVAAVTDLPSLSKNFVRHNTTTSSSSNSRKMTDAIIEIEDDDDDDDDMEDHYDATARLASSRVRIVPQNNSTMYARMSVATECFSTDDESLISKPKSSKLASSTRHKHDTAMSFDAKLPPKNHIDLQDEDDDDDDDLLSFHRFDRKQNRLDPSEEEVTIRISSPPTRSWPASQLSISSSSSSSSGDGNSFLNCNNQGNCVPVTSMVQTKVHHHLTNATAPSDDTDDDDNDSDDDSLDAIKHRLNTKPVAVAVAPKNSDGRRPQKSAPPKPNVTKRRVGGADQTNAAQTKLLEREKRNEDRIRIRNDKEAEKIAKREQRERQRTEKQLADEAEKVAKKRYREECKQTSGKLAKEEIAVLLKKDLFHSYTVIPDLEKMGYHVQDHPSALQCNAIQWIRKDALQGGAELAVQHLHSTTQSEYQHFPIVTILIDDAEAFVKLLARSPDDEDDDDYPALEDWLMGIEYGWRASWKIPSTTETNVTVSQQPTRPRLILLLVKITEALDKMWIQYRKALSANDHPVTNHRSTSNTTNTTRVTTTMAQQHPPPTAEELHDAITWILIQFQIECVHCKSNEDVSVQLCKVTRLLAESPYRKPVTEFSCIKKIKPTHNLDENDEANNLERAKDCWMRQLQQIPNLSQPRALHFIQYYPTPFSLWLAYQNPSLTVPQKRSLVAHCFHENRLHMKLSEQLYSVMTSQNPHEMIH